MIPKIYNIMSLEYKLEKWDQIFLKDLISLHGKATFKHCSKWKVNQLLHRYTPGVHLQYVWFFESIRYMLIVYTVSYISPFVHQTSPPLW